MHSTSSSWAAADELACELATGRAQPRTGSQEPPARSTSLRAALLAAIRALAAAFDALVLPLEALPPPRLLEDGGLARLTVA